MPGGVDTDVVLALSPVTAGMTVTMAAQGDLAYTLVAAGVKDERVLDAVRSIPREAFVPPGHEHEADLDAPVPLPHGQTTSQPSLVARMVEALGLTGKERVLEIGTGYGYQTALLARLATFVVSIDRWDELAARARENLARQGIDNTEVLSGDGTQGVPEHAPYDAIVVSAAFPEVPAPLVEQLRVGGRVIQPIGSGGGESVVLFDLRPEGLVRRQELTPARFVRLVGGHGYPE